MNCRTYKKAELMWNLTMGLALVGALILSGCAVEVVDQDQKQEPKNESTIQNESASEYHLEPLPEPNRYRIHFREDLRADAVMTSSEVLEGGKTYEFQTRTRRLLKVQVPRDLVFGELTSPKDPKRLEDWEIKTDGRVFLLRSALLITMGNNLTIEANEIVSSGALIQTFDSNSEAEVGKQGVNGGRIYLKAAKASGNLFIEIRGQKGGRGPTGAPFAETAAPGAGGGGMGMFPGSRGGCISGPGGPGADGKDGGPGGRGNNGGDSGSLWIEIQDRSNLNLKADLFEGLAGDGGRGGPGQQGGPGGAGSCGAANGQPGKDGNPGIAGPIGRPGQKGEICYLQNNQMKCD